MVRIAEALASANNLYEEDNVSFDGGIPRAALLSGDWPFYRGIERGEPSGESQAGTATPLAIAEHSGVFERSSAWG